MPSDGATQDVVLPFYVAWACKQMLERALKPGVDGNLRDLANRQFREMYERGDGNSLRVELHGTPVGTYTFPASKAVPAHREVTVKATDWDAIAADPNADFREWLEEWVGSHLGELAETYVKETGDSVDGVSVIVQDVPESPSVVSPNGRPGGVRPEKVAEALGTSQLDLLRELPYVLAGAPAISGDGAHGVPALADGTS